MQAVKAVSAPLRFAVLLKAQLDSAGRQLAGLFQEPLPHRLPASRPVVRTLPPISQETAPARVSQGGVPDTVGSPARVVQHPLPEKIITHTVREVIKEPVTNNYYSITNSPSQSPAGDTSFLAQLSALRQELQAALNARIENLSRRSPEGG